MRLFIHSQTSTIQPLKRGNLYLSLLGVSGIKGVAGIKRHEAIHPQEQLELPNLSGYQDFQLRFSHQMMQKFTTQADIVSVIDDIL